MTVTPITAYEHVPADVVARTKALVVARDTQRSLEQARGVARDTQRNLAWDRLRLEPFYRASVRRNIDAVVEACQAHYDAAIACADVFTMEPTPEPCSHGR